MRIIVGLTRATSGTVTIAGRHYVDAVTGVAWLLMPLALGLAFVMRAEVT